MWRIYPRISSDIHIWEILIFEIFSKAFFSDTDIIRENHVSENHPRKSCIREPSEKIMYPRMIRENHLSENHPRNHIIRYIFTHPRNMSSEIQLFLLFKFCLSTEFLVSKIDLRYFLWSGLFRSEIGQNFIRDQHTVKCLSYFTIFYVNLCFLSYEFL